MTSRERVAAAFLEQKGDYSAWFVTRAGIFPTTLSMGLEAFSIALFEDRGLVEEVLDRYFDWSVGVAGLHPNEKGAMDIRANKAAYGNRLCLLGNVDLNILGMGTVEDVETEVRGLIRDVGPGGGYIVSSGNSLAGYLQPDNVMAMAATVRCCGVYPIDLK